MTAYAPGDTSFSWNLDGFSICIVVAIYVVTYWFNPNGLRVV